MMMISDVEVNFCGNLKNEFSEGSTDVQLQKSSHLWNEFQTLQWLSVVIFKNEI